MQTRALPLEITIISAEGLHLSRCPLKKNIFVTIHTGPRYHRSTKIDYQGNGNPSWNQKFDVEVPSNVPNIVVKVKRKTLLRNAIVGIANIPVTDITKDYKPENHMHFLSYHLRGRFGESKGIVNLSIKVKDKSSWVRDLGNGYYIV